jgi:hypothetical protein
MRNNPGAKRRHTRTGTLMGWGVFRIDPWHFVGIFGSRRQADARAQEIGIGYVVRLGELQEGTDKFEWSVPEKGSGE